MESEKGDDLGDWRTMEPEVYMVHNGEGGDDDSEDSKPKRTAVEEFRLMEQQVEESKGFDIDFSMFRCVFNFRPVPFDSEYGEFLSDTTAKDLMDNLSKEALDGFNSKYSTKYEFVKVIKANFHACAGILFYMTFKGKLLPCDNNSKKFQARVWYGCSGSDVLSCELKAPPQKQVHSIEAPEKEDPKKPRLIQEPSNV